MFRPNREFQASLNADETRRRRQNNSLSLRRKDRETKLQKKRQRILKRHENGINKVNNQQSPPQMNKSPPQSPTNYSNYGLNEERVEDLSRYVQGVYHSNPATQYECVKHFRTALSKQNKPPIKQVVDSGVVPRFIQLAQDNKYPQLQYEALWTLLNIASGPAEATAHIITRNAHMTFISLLRNSQFYEIKDQAMWALGNIAGDCAELKDLLLNNGILAAVLQTCQLRYDSKCNTNFNGNEDIKGCPMWMFISMLSTTSWCLSNLCRSTPPPTMQHLELIIQCIISLMQHAINFMTNKGQIFINNSGHYANDRINDLIDEILSNLAWATSYLTGFESAHFTDSNAPDYIIKRLGESRIIAQFVHLIDYENASVRHACNRVIGNILTGSDENTSKCVELGVLQKYFNVLTNYCPLSYNKKFEIPPAKQAIKRERKEICWSISNIAAGPLEHKLEIEKSGLFPILVKYLGGATHDVQKEALWAISNATCDSNKSIINPLVTKYKLIEAMTNYLTKIQTFKKRPLIVAIECISNILECGQQHLCEGDDNPYLVKFEEEGLLQFLEELQGDEDLEETIFESVQQIIDKYWNGNNVQDGNNQTLLDYGIDQINQEMQNSFHRNNNNNNNNHNTPQSNNNGHFNFGVNFQQNSNNGNNGNNGGYQL